MNEDKLQKVLENHNKWLRGEGGRRANLSHANLHRANLSHANLHDANLHRANLSRAYLSDANLSRANLSDANLSRAYLSDANLSHANLSDVNLSGADLRGTCLDSDYRHVAKAAKYSSRGGIILYRTAKSQHVGNIDYTTRKTHHADALSHDTTTDCHSGIYGYPTIELCKSEYPDSDIVMIYARSGEFVYVPGKNAVRCLKVRSLGVVYEADNLKSIGA